MTNKKTPAPRKRAPAPSKNVKNRRGKLLPSTRPELAAAGLAGVVLYTTADGKRLDITLEMRPVACHYGYGTWHLLYLGMGQGPMKAKRKP